MLTKLTCSLVLPLVLVVLAPGCGGDDGDDAGGGGEAVQIDLAEQNASGQSGTATLEPTGDGTTRVVLDLSNAPDDPQPVHIHAGSCAELREVVHPLENLEGGSSETTVDVPLEDLQTGEFAVNAHESEENIQNYVACGDIPAS